MIEIDGSQKSGSGTILRDSICYSVLTGQELVLRNIRVKRPKPGLRHQHLKAVEACARISGASVEGAALGSRELRFTPGPRIEGGAFRWDIATAGSTAMLALALLPLALFASGASSHEVTGGLFQDFAPSLFHFEHVLLPLLRRMGAMVQAKIIQPGYVPKGHGCIRVGVTALEGTLQPIVLPAQGTLSHVSGIALSSLLKPRRVSERMAEACGKTLAKRGLNPRIEILNDLPEQPAFSRASVQPGAALGIWATTEGGCIIGADMAGARGRSAETIGRETSLHLIEDLKSGASVDRHVADQIVPFAALAQGSSTFLIPGVTDHVEARLWLIQKMLGAGVEVDGRRITIHGIGMKRVPLSPRLNTGSTP